MIANNKVCILGIPYTIAYEVLDEEDGYISPNRQHIGIRQGMSSEKTTQTLMHELVHGILDQLGYSELYEDEHLVQGLAVGLCEALF